MALRHRRLRSLLTSPGDLTPEARERVLDWWASALDREARPRPDIERQAVLSPAHRRRWAPSWGRDSDGASASSSSRRARSGSVTPSGVGAAIAGWSRAARPPIRAAALRPGFLERPWSPEASGISPCRPDVAQPLEFGTRGQQWEQWK